MTGFGEARVQSPRWTIVVEVRTVNNRHFKLSAKISESHAMIEPALEQLVREKVRRGTVQVNLRIERPRRPEDYRLNLTALNSYRDQLKALQGFDERSVDVAALLALPGRRRGLVGRCRECPRRTGPRSPAQSALALEKLEASRAQEGKAMALELSALGRGIRGHLSAIAERGPQAVAEPCRRGSASESRRSCTTAA